MLRRLEQRMEENFQRIVENIAKERKEMLDKSNRERDRMMLDIKNLKEEIGKCKMDVHKEIETILNEGTFTFQRPENAYYFSVVEPGM